MFLDVTEVRCNSSKFTFCITALLEFKNITSLMLKMNKKHFFDT